MSIFANDRESATDKKTFVQHVQCVTSTLSWTQSRTDFDKQISAKGEKIRQKDEKQNEVSITLPFLLRKKRAG